MIYAIVQIVILWSFGTTATMTAALLLRARLGWANAGIFGIVIALAEIGVQVIAPSVGVTIAFAACFACELALGAWFLGPRAQRSDGTPVGAGRGAILAGLAQVLLMALGLVLILGYRLAVR
jgi:hypothetical protein